MIKYKAHWKCPCGSLTWIEYKKPGFMNPSTTNFECSGCESLIYATITRPKEKELRLQRNVHIKVQFLKISDDLRLILMEKESERSSMRFKIVPETGDAFDIEADGEENAKVIAMDRISDPDVKFVMEPYTHTESNEDRAGR